MNPKLLIIIGIIASVTMFAIYTSGAFTPLQPDLSECYYTDDDGDIPQPCMKVDGWFDVLLQSSMQTANNPCDPKYMVVGDNECVLDPKYIEPNTVIIYDIVENGGTRLSIAPHALVMNLTDGNTVQFVNEAATAVNVFDNSKETWRYDDVKPSSRETLIINGTGYHQFLIQNSRDGETGKIVALSEDTNSLPVEIRAKMAQSIVSHDFATRSELVSVGSGGAEPGITIGIHEKFEDLHDDAEMFYREKYGSMIPFDVPIRIEFRAPFTLLNG